MQTCTVNYEVKLFSLITCAFLLISELWLEWIEDEKSICEDRQIIYDLFERAVNDYLSASFILTDTKLSLKKNKNVTSIIHHFFRC